MQVQNFTNIQNFKGIIFNKKNKNENMQNVYYENTNLNNAPSSLYGIPMVHKIEHTERIHYPKHTQTNYTGCLLGGAIGDALGWPVEFKSLRQIINQYGENGITDLVKRNGKSEITDDTQMTIFTADGLLKSALSQGIDDNLPNMDIIYNSYQNWLDTQNGRYVENNNGWISNIKDLWDTRAPGNTCLGSLYRGVPGSIENPANSSKGCGGVMRVAPAGLMYYKNPNTAFEVGARCAALTHGSPDAYLAGGIHASIIAEIINGENIHNAVDKTIERLKDYKGHENIAKLVERAKKYASSDIEPRSAICNLGEGWHGDEAIAIAIYCVLKEPNDFKKALIMAVNHNGDSDSTGAIVGNILGAYLGESKIPQDWKESVELSNELRQLSKDLYIEPNEIKDSKRRYSTN